MAPGLRTGEAADDDLNSHEPILRCKVTALLALLDGRAHIAAEDWELARVMWTTSCAVRQATVEYGIAQRELAEQASTRRYVAREEAKAAAVGSPEGKLTRLAKTLADKAATAGGFLTDGAAKQRLHSRDRGLYEQIKEYGSKRGMLRTDDDGIHTLPARDGGVSPRASRTKQDTRTGQDRTGQDRTGQDRTLFVRARKKALRESVIYQDKNL
jgi:hypothetical protein